MPTPRSSVRKSPARPKSARPSAAVSAAHVDVLIIGAGISGIGAAWHLQHRQPGTTFTVLEMAETFGGTWHYHRYPGIRSDSDLHTFGYSFKPWRGAPIATAAEIQRYLGEVIAENGLDRHIRYRHKVLSVAWSSETCRWTIEAQRLDTDQRLTFTANLLWMCPGYYRHNEGFMPPWPGREQFQGRLVHSEEWPSDLDLAGKRVVVVGSGATAATVIPAIADTTRHVVMLQRSPTYFLTGRNAIDLVTTLRELKIDEAWIHEITRRKMLYDQAAFMRRCATEPEAVTKELIGAIRQLLGPDYDIAKHFTPSYPPWRQRVAFVPDADMFKAIAAGKASVVTDTIERITPTGIALTSGEHLDADVIIAATGFNLSALGDIALSVDGLPVDYGNTITYRGMMFTGLPNLVSIFGYIRASWTLRVDLVADVVCRLLDSMREKGAARVDIVLRPQDQGMRLGPWLDPANFNPGYMARGMHLLPRSGDKPEWAHSHDYWSDKDVFPAIDLNDPVFVYGGPRRLGAAAE
jgi:cation diffusion facilitator CzcD-associated flavoprotein CzcO